MPRDGSGTYNKPFPDVEPDTTIESAVYNGFVNDVEQDLNTPRPIGSGGTGAESGPEALANIGGEMASQLVTNFDNHVWFPGSFRAAMTASGSPVADHAFSGWVYSSDPPAFPPSNQNVIVEARDMTQTVPPGEPGLLYTRAKRAGVWGAWRSLKEYIDGRIIVAPDPPTVTDPPPTTLWWDSDSGQLFVRYKDVDDTIQWVSATTPGAMGPQGPTGETGPTGATGATGPPDGRTRYVVGGLTTFDVAVPDGTYGARITGVLRPGSAAAGFPILQLSLTASTFISTAGNYTVSGFYNVATVSGANSVDAGTSHAGMQLASNSGDVVIPTMFDARIVLKRGNTASRFTLDSNSLSYSAANGAIHSFFANWLAAAAGTQLTVLALRFLPSNGVAWGPESYITVEWL
jgi:hypothetical protein